MLLQNQNAALQAGAPMAAGMARFAQKQNLDLPRTFFGLPIEAITGMVGQPGGVANALGLNDSNIFDAIKGYQGAVGKTLYGGFSERMGPFLQATHPDQGYWDDQQYSLFRQFMNTGKPPAGLDPNFAISFFDHAIRDAARQERNDAAPSLFDRLIKKALPGAVAAGFTGGLFNALGTQIPGIFGDGGLLSNPTLRTFGDAYGIARGVRDLYDVTGTQPASGSFGAPSSSHTGPTQAPYGDTQQTAKFPWLALAAGIPTAAQQPPATQQSPGLLSTPDLNVMSEGLMNFKGQYRGSAPPGPPQARRYFDLEMNPYAPYRGGLLNG